MLGGNCISWGKLSGSFQQALPPGLIKPLSSVPTVVSMKSPIFGPQEVNRLDSASASIKCYYPATSVNRHSRKYWCQQGARGRCTTLISSERYVSKDYKGKANLTDFPESNMFVVDIGHLTQNDSGRYRCGLGMNNQDLFFDVSLKVSPGEDLVSLGICRRVRENHFRCNGRA